MLVQRDCPNNHSPHLLILTHHQQLANIPEALSRLLGNLGVESSSQFHENLIFHSSLSDELLDGEENIVPENVLGAHEVEEVVFVGLPRYPVPVIFLHYKSSRSVDFSRAPIEEEKLINYEQHRSTLVICGNTRGNLRGIQKTRAAEQVPQQAPFH